MGGRSQTSVGPSSSPRAFFEDRHHFASTALPIHHQGPGDAAGLPVGGGFCEVANLADVSFEAFAVKDSVYKTYHVGVVEFSKLWELRGVRVRVVAADNPQRGEVAGFCGSMAFKISV